MRFSICYSFLFGKFCKLAILLFSNMYSLGYIYDLFYKNCLYLKIYDTKDKQKYSLIFLVYIFHLYYAIQIFCLYVVD